MYEYNFVFNIVAHKHKHSRKYTHKHFEAKRIIPIQSDAIVNPLSFLPGSFQSNGNETKTRLSKCIDSWQKTQIM